jgi:hypothetical protein
MPRATHGQEDEIARKPGKGIISATSVTSHAFKVTTRNGRFTELSERGSCEEGR